MRHAPLCWAHRVQEVLNTEDLGKIVASAQDGKLHILSCLQIPHIPDLTLISTHTE